MEKGCKTGRVEKKRGGNVKTYEKAWKEGSGRLKEGERREEKEKRRSRRGKVVETDKLLLFF